MQTYGFAPGCNPHLWHSSCMHTYIWPAKLPGLTHTLSGQTGLVEQATLTGSSRRSLKSMHIGSLLRRLHWDMHACMLRSGDKTGQYSGMLDCFVKSFRSGGILTFYNGFLPNFARLGSWNCAMFLTVEQVWVRSAVQSILLGALALEQALQAGHIVCLDALCCVHWQVRKLFY